VVCRPDARGVRGRGPAGARMGNGAARCAPQPARRSRHNPGVITPAADPVRRRLPALLAMAVRLVWAASPRDLLIVGALQLLQGSALLGVLLAIRGVLDTVLSTGTLAATLPLVGLLVLLLASVGVVGAVVAERDQLLSEVVAQDVQRRLLAVASQMDYRAFETPVLHDRLDRATRQAAMGPVQAVQGLVGVSGALVAAAGATVALVVLQPLLLLPVLLAAVPSVIASARTGRLYAEFVFGFTPAERERSYLATVLSSRTAAKELRVLRLAPHLQERWQRLSARRLTELRRVTRRQLVTISLGEIGAAAMLGTSLVLLVAFIAGGQLTAADAGAAAAALLLLGQRVQAVGIAAGMLVEVAPFLRDLADLLATAAGAERDRPTAPAPAGFRRITVEDVSFTHPSGDRPALRDVSLTLEQGEVVALVGENGSGKTTLATLLCGLHRPDAGRICWDGVDLTTVDRDGLRDQITVLFQDFQRFALPARDNVGFGRVERRDDLTGIRAAAADAGADDFLAALPGGYDTILGPEFAGGSDLSGGQWQRVALARAFFRNAPLVILDEPTAALDPPAERALFDAVRSLFRGRTVLLVSHRYPSVRAADRIVVLHEGRVVECGTHDDLVGLGGHYAALYEAQMALYGR
jgi:ATP-binding cassette subfamily B protein